jgi:lysophospholipase L1-like esterase
LKVDASVDGRTAARSLRADNLHPQAKGYEIWGEAVMPKLRDLLK